MCMRNRNVLKPNFHKCRGCAMLVDSCFRVWRAQNFIALLPVRACKLPRLRRPYRAENGNLRKSGSNFRYGTVFAPKQSLYQKETRGIYTMVKASLSDLTSTETGVMSITQHLQSWKLNSSSFLVLKHACKEDLHDSGNDFI